MRMPKLILMYNIILDRQKFIVLCYAYALMRNKIIKAVGVAEQVNRNFSMSNIFPLYPHLLISITWNVEQIVRIK